MLKLSGFSTYSGGTTIEAGRVVASIPLANTNTSPGLAIAALGGIDVRSPQALGTGAVTLKGGILAFNNNVALAEVEDGPDFNTFGSGAVSYTNPPLPPKSEGCDAVGRETLKINTKGITIIT